MELAKMAAEAFFRGDLDTAEVMARSSLVAAPNDADVSMLLGLVVAAKGNPAAAKTHFLKALELVPNSIDARLNVAMACVQTGEAERAVALLQPVVAAASPPAQALMIFGEACVLCGRNRAAEAAFQAAARHVETRADALLSLGRLLAEGGQTATAEAAYFSLRELASLSAQQRFELARLALALTRDSEALELLTGLFQDEFLGQAAIVLSATTLERRNRAREAQQLLNQLGDAVADGVKADLALVRARLLVRDRQFALAEAEARAGTESAQDGAVLAELQFLIGNSLDAQGRYTEAYPVFQQANATARKGRNERVDVDWDGDAEFFNYDLKELSPGFWQPGDNEHSKPVFIVGFPRSGTTLLDRMLDAHPALRVLEERPTFEGVLASIGANEQNYLSKLAAATAPQLEAMRKRYLDNVSRLVGIGEPGRVVDKYPLNLLRLPLIAKLFPGAPVIFVIRDPRDCVLSCFMQNFRAFRHIVGFTTLPHSAKLYANIMGLFLQMREQLAYPLCEVRYEQLIVNPEHEVRKVLTHCGVEWDDAVLDYRQGLEGRRIGTPSYEQVTRPLYTSSVSRWRNYAGAAGDALAPLQPFIEGFGY